MIGVQPLSLEQVEVALGGQRGEQWLRQLLRACMESDSKRISFLRLPENRYDPRLHSLFFSDEKMFQYYCDTQNIPVSSNGDVGRIAIVTSLPERLLELEPRKFWENLATT